MWLTDLADVARDAGLSVVERHGWKTRGRGEMTAVDSILVHHTAGPASGNAPSLNLVQDGRTDLPGPLAQLVLGRDGTVYVVAAGRANHAGVVSHTRYTNSHAIGIEAENTGTAADPWPSRQYDAYVTLTAALAEHYGVPTGHVLGHREAARPAGRKIDPTYSGAFTSMKTFRRDVHRERRRLGLTPDIGLTFLNVKGGDDEGRETFDARRASLADVLTGPRLALATAVEVPADLLPGLDLVMEARGYRRRAYGRSAAIWARTDLIRSGRFKRIAQQTVVLDKQNKGRTESVTMLAFILDGRRYAVAVTHLDVHGGDALRSAQMKQALKAYRTFCRTHRVPWLHRLIAADHNTTSGTLVRMLARRGWVAAIESTRCAIWRRAGRPQWAAWLNHLARSDHPLLAARTARKAKK